KGPTKVPLLTDMTVLNVAQSQRPLPLMQEGRIHEALLNGPGPFSVAMDVATPFITDTGRTWFVLPVPTASSASLKVDIAGNHANLHVEPGLITSRTTSNGHTIVEATLEPGKQARVWWSTREAAAPVTQHEVRFLADIKSLFSIGDSDVRLAALCDVTVVQGEPSELKIPIPAGFEMIEATGSTLDSTETNGGVLTVRLREPSRRAHQFLIALEKASRDNKLEAPLLGITGAQRETGEALVEGSGTMELGATADGSLKRIDVREASAIARSLARFPIQAAFRYHRRPVDASGRGEQPKLELEWTQFPDNSVLSAI